MRRLSLLCLVIAGLLSSRERAAAQTYSFTHLAGNIWGAGYADGIGNAARLDQPFGVAADAFGNVYVADWANHTIRKIIASSGLVTTLAGQPGVTGSADGIGGAARFSYPSDVAADGFGNLYVADYGNDTIRKVVIANGQVTTLAGLAFDRGGVAASVDGVGSAARFGGPNAVTADPFGNLYIADIYNHTIRKIEVATAQVTTVAGLAGTSGAADGAGSAARFFNPNGVVADTSGNVYVSDTGNSTIRKIVVATRQVTTIAGQAGSSSTANGIGSAARFYFPRHITVDRAGIAYVGQDTCVRKIDVSTAQVSTLAGHEAVGAVGSADGIGGEAQFYGAAGVAADPFGNVYVADANNSTIRKIIASTGQVTTLAGRADPVDFPWDGIGSTARFRFPGNVTADNSGNVYVGDGNGSIIRRIVVSTGQVTTVAGLLFSWGSADGVGSAARFLGPSVAADGSGNIYVADRGNQIIRKIAVSTGQVTTIAGQAGTIGSADGIGSAARFCYPSAIATDGVGNLYVADNGDYLAGYENSTIRRIVVATGQVTTLAGHTGAPSSADGSGAAAGFYAPWGVAADGAGNVYVADTLNNTIRMIVAATGKVTTLAGNAGKCGAADGVGSEARFCKPQGVAADGTGNVYVADTWNFNIRRIAVATGQVTTVGGLGGATGNVDGSGNAARFAFPQAVAVDGAGKIYVADTNNNAIRMGIPFSPAVFVPIVLNVTGLAPYTSELQLTNLGPSPATVKLSYTGSIGSGSGNVGETIPAGQQVVYPDAISYLRLQGVSIPASGNQGGTLTLSNPSGGVHAIVRTGSDTAPPQPTGRAGLAYTDIDPAASASVTKVYVYGLRANDSDRSNLAVYNMGPEPVSLKLTLVSGDNGNSVEVTAGQPLSLPAYGWYQYSGVLNNAGFSSGYAIVERTVGSWPFGAYGVVNDQKTNDGSFIPGLSDTLSGSKLTVPALVETSAFASELILTNRGGATATFALHYFESLSPAKGSGGTTTLDVVAGQQRIIPNAIDFLRSKGVSIGARGEASYAGSLQIQMSGVGMESVFAGARTSSLSPVGGEFGVFYPGIGSSQEFSDLAFVLGLKADVNNRSNVAVLHTGPQGSGPITLELQVLDGSEGGKAVGQPLSVVLNPGDWVQPSGFFAAANVPNGYVRIRRTAGTAPWYAYGVINDGGQPGQRTGDGSYVPGVQP